MRQRAREKILQESAIVYRQRAWLLWEPQKTYTQLTQLLPRAANKCFGNKWRFLLSDVYTS